MHPVRKDKMPTTCLQTLVRRAHALLRGRCMAAALVFAVAVHGWVAPAAAQADAGLPPLSARMAAALEPIKALEAASNRPFGIIDKGAARLYLFDQRGRFLQAAPVLLGLAQGDVNPPGIGKQAVASIRAHEKITPAGRFVVEPGHNLRGEEVLWLDYESGLSMHPVLRTGNRLQRLASSTAADNRISAGCINVPTGFHHGVLLKLFHGPRGGVVYILPEKQDISSWVAVLKIK